MNTISARITFIIAIVIICFGLSSSVTAVDTQWKGGAGDWSTASNWDNGEPDSTVDTWFGTAAYPTASTVTISATGEATEDLKAGVTGVADTVNFSILSGAELTVYREATFGYLSVCDVNQIGGTVNCNAATLYLGRFGGGKGLYHVRGGQLNALYIILGFEGYGHLMVQGGNVDVDRVLYLAYTPSSTEGLMSIVSGSVNVASSLHVGSQQEATIHQYGGDAVYATDGSSTFLGGDYDFNNAAGNGTYIIEDGNCIFGGRVYCGYLGTGKIIQSGGYVNYSDNGLFIGYHIGSQGTLEISGGTMDVNDSVANNGLVINGTLKILDNSAVINVSGGHLKFANTSSFEEVAEGSVITMKGEDCHLIIENSDADSMAGLKNLNLVYDGTSNTVFEVCSKDNGPSVSAYIGNDFQLSSLTIGGSNPSEVVVNDQYDNQNDTLLENEALYVHALNVTSGSTLIVDDVSIYYVEGVIDGDVVLIGDALVQQVDRVCGDIWTEYVKEDINMDCYVDFADFAAFSADWLECTDPANGDCI